MTELSALNIRITGDSKDLQTAITAANGDLAKLVSGAQAAGLKVSQIPFKPAAQGAAGMSQSLRGVTQQLSQVGQQTMATGNFLQALAIQLPDIGLGFGAIGSAAGLLAGIALPMVAAALLNVGTSASAMSETVKTAMADIGVATTDLQAKIDQLRFGVDEEYQVELLQEQIRLRGEITAKIGEGQAYLASTTDSLDRQRITIDGINAAVAALASRHNQITGLLADQENRTVQLAISEGVVAQRAGEVAAKQAVAAKETAAHAAAMEKAGISAAELAAIGFGNIAQAVGYAQSLATAMQSAANYSAMIGSMGQASGPDAVRTQLGGGGKFTPVVSGAGLPTPKGVGGGSGGGGGGGAAAESPYQAELEALQESLMSQEQLEIESYQRRMETLKGALEQRLITQQEYAALMEQVEKTHQFAMGAETRAGVSATLSALGQLFEGSKKIGAGIALANSFLAFTEVLKDKAYEGRPWARFAAAAQALASGLSAVRSIKSAQPGGGGATGGGASMSAPQGGNPMQVSLNTFGGGDFIRTADFGMILDKLNQEAGDRGYTILSVPA